MNKYTIGKCKYCKRIVATKNGICFECIDCVDFTEVLTDENISDFLGMKKEH